MNATAAINACNNVSVESSVIGADPHMFISMLYQSALLEIAYGKNNEILRKETAAKDKFISRAIAIIGERLNASLDKGAGGELAQNLTLYDYMVMRLIDANVENNITVLGKVTRLLTRLTEAWNGIHPNSVKSEPQSMHNTSMKA